MKELERRNDDAVERNASAADKKRPTAHPRSMIWTAEGKVVITMEMPGVTKENLALRVEDGRLYVHGMVGADSNDKGRYVVRERRNLDFHNVYTLDDTIDRDRIDAVMENGLLTVTLNLKEVAKPRKIEVR